MTAARSLELEARRAKVNAGKGMPQWQADGVWIGRREVDDVDKHGEGFKNPAAAES